MPGPQSKVSGTEAWALRVMALVSDGTSHEGDDALAAMGRRSTDADWGARATVVVPSRRGSMK